MNRRRSVLGLLLGTVMLSSVVGLTSQERGDWLIKRDGFPAAISISGPDLVLSNGLVRRIIRLDPAVATIALDNLATDSSLVRSVRPEGEIRINGKSYALGGLVGQRVHNFLSSDILKNLTPQSNALPLRRFSMGTTQERFPWKKRAEWLSARAQWPPPGKSLTLFFEGPGQADIRVHYEIFDGVPLFSKWITVHNAGKEALKLESVVVHQLAVIEPESIVDGSPSNFRRNLSQLEVFSTYAFGGNMTGNADAPAIQWLSDPLYSTQVHYEKQTPCLVQCSTALGPDVVLEPGGQFESFRVFELLHDSTDRERRGLALRRAYRLLAPWVQENPILMHVRSAKPEAVRLAIDQCAEVGFEMAIMTFGSGFDIENDNPAYLAQVKELADYARSKGIALGGYSLLASRSIDPLNDAINPNTGKPGGMRFGNSPCLSSQWGETYFHKLKSFYAQTGCEVLEHDGSYPGDVCAATDHPGHTGLGDSQWKQWRKITEFYRWCRSEGIYLNVPDWYYLTGSSKCAMGYRETNWSLPREEQEIIERQNIFDGTWEKTPTMGWMFVPLTEYHGGGKAATIEPLQDHLEHYETRLANLFGAGVQACYRGPRLFDAPETKAVVKRWVDFYKAHRAILDSDIIHLRRADGRDWDGWLHVNPDLQERALAMLYNPLSTPLHRRIAIPLYYSGLSESALVKDLHGHTRRVKFDREYKASIDIEIPAKGRVCLTFHE